MIDGKPWFVAAGGCEALGLKAGQTNRSYQNHCRRLDADELGVAPASVLRTSRKMKIISESGLYKMVMHSVL